MLDRIGALITICIGGKDLGNPFHHVEDIKQG